LTKVPGSPGWFYQLDPGRVLKPPGRGDSSDDDKLVEVLSWCPIVTERLVTLREDGSTGETYYRLILGDDDTVTVSHEEVTTHKAWHRLAMPGTGSRTTRDVLTNIISGQGARLPRVLAVTRTGWHATPEGGRIYVYPDGRTWPEAGQAHLIGIPERLALAAAPVEPVEEDQARAVLAEMVTRGGWAPLFGAGAGARALGQSIRPVSAALVVWGDPNSGKTCTATAGRLLMLAPTWPPVVTARFNDTVTDLEMSVDAEADMPTLLDDLALTADASQVEQRAGREMLERIIRPVGNGEAIRGRRKRDLTAMDRRYVRSIPTITAQQLPRGMQASLYRRAVVLKLRAGDAVTRWWSPKDKGGMSGAERVGPALRTIGDRIIARLGTADDPGALLASAERAALAVLGPAVDRAAPGWVDNADGLSGVIHAAAGMMAGLVLIAEAVGVEAAPLLAAVAEPVARGLAEQADTMSDRRKVADDLAAAVGDLIRKALWERRAHVSDRTGDLGPGRGPHGLTTQEMGLRNAGRSEMGLTMWEGGGARLYWLPERGTCGGVAVRSTALHDLARASADPRLSGYSSTSLGAALGLSGALLPSPQKGRAWSHSESVEGSPNKQRFLMIRPEVIWADLFDPGESGPPARPVEAPPEVGPGTPEVSPSDNSKIISGETAGTHQDQLLGLVDPARPAETGLISTIEAPAATSEVLALGADSDGLYLGDGRALDPGDAYASMPAFLSRVVEMMPAGGTVAITAEVAARLGYPARPDNARPGRGQSGARKSRQECPAVIAGAAAGWQSSAAGIGAWTTWYGSDRPSLSVVVLDWLDPKRMGVSGEPYLRAEHDAVTAAYLLAAYRDRLGVPYVMTAGTSGLHLIRDEYGPERRGRRRAPLMKWRGDGTPATEVHEMALGWSRPPTDDEQAAGWVIGYDTRMAYLAAAGIAEVAVNALEHVGVAEGFDPGRAGYWRVSEGAWRPFPMLPALTGRVRDEGAWLTTPTVRLLVDQGMPVEAITDAWLSTGRDHTARVLRRPAERIRDAIAGIPEDVANEDAMVRAALKATYREMIGMLRHGTAWGVRPDWADTVVGTARTNLLRKAIRIGEETGRWPLRIDTDCLFYAAGTDDVHAACPDGLKIYDESKGGPQLGTVVPKHVATMSDYRAYLTEKGEINA
jgi:hypothetical protein